MMHNYSAVTDPGLWQALSCNLAHPFLGYVSSSYHDPLRQTTWARVWRVASSPYTRTERPLSRLARTSLWAMSAFMVPRRCALTGRDPHVLSDSL